MVPPPAWSTTAAILGTPERHAELITELQRLVAEHPLRERLHALLMIALYRCGRQAEAIAVYQQARRLLVGELGCEPGPELRRVHQQILNDDPALAAPPPRRPRRGSPWPGGAAGTAGRYRGISPAGRGSCAR